MGHIFGIISKDDLLSGRIARERAISDICSRSNQIRQDKQEILLPRAIVSISCGKTKAVRTEKGFFIFKGLLFEDDLKEVFSRFNNLSDVQSLQSFTSDIDFEGIFIIYSAEENCIALIRDRIGIGQLYWASHGDNFYFSTRPDNIGVHPDLDSEFDVQYSAIYAASHYRYIDANIQGSPFKDVHRLSPATILVNEAGSILQREFWRLRVAPFSEKSEEKLAEEYATVLKSAVARRLSHANNPAFLLSGGMDSSSVASCAWQQSGAGVTAYSTVYSDATYDEYSEIQSMLNDRVATWTPVTLDSPNLLELVPRMVACHGEPVCTSTWLSHFEVSQRVAGNGHDVLFGGLGGDELNAGEFEYFPFFFADLRSANQFDSLNNEIAKWAEYHNHPIYRKGRIEAENMMIQYCDLKNPGTCRPNLQRLLRYMDVLEPAYFSLAEFKPAMPKLTDSYLTNRCYQDLILETTPCCVRSEQRHGDTFGFISTDPFLDYRVVEFMFSVPGTLKIRDGITKYLLRVAMKGILPEETRTRIKKTGWNAPAHQWFLQGGMELILDLLPKEGVGLYVPERVEKLIDEHRDIVLNNMERENHMMFLWQTLNMLCWRRYVNELRSELSKFKNLELK